MKLTESDKLQVLIGDLIETVAALEVQQRHGGSPGIVGRPVLTGLVAKLDGID